MILLPNHFSQEQNSYSMPVNIIDATSASRRCFRPSNRDCPLTYLGT